MKEPNFVSEREQKLRVYDQLKAFWAKKLGLWGHRNELEGNTERLIERKTRK